MGSNPTLRIGYTTGGISVGITATFASYGYWVLYEEDNDCNTDEGTERGGEEEKAYPRR